MSNISERRSFLTTACSVLMCIKPWIRSAAIYVGIPAGLSLALLYVGQDKMLFQPSPPIPRAQVREYSKDSGCDVLDVNFKMKDGVMLHGFLFKAQSKHTGDSTGTTAPQQQQRRRPTMVYWGGNAENVLFHFPAFDPSFRAMAAARWNVVLMSYRGYGYSEGRPSGANVCNDAVEVYDALVQREDVDPTKIFVWGRSLGSGAAMQTAADRPVAGAILATPFAILSDVVQTVLPFVPSFILRMMFRNNIDNMRHAASLRVPVLLVHGTADELIPHEHSSRLRDSIPGAELLLLRNRGHNDIDDSADYPSRAVQFLEARL
eukprot:gnl/Spiro4/10093_TR5358_c0_g1_i1.p1 gnl/Spiro4/10093_TR5358_c0_g1~~gnl/Spiro4/10093_TR5358_c0_g1_i1.p1  ORF type:complete len:333 (-),score=60.93 gnl/Spiro4/10093_TR5358_c0_g1_i1:172-1128(-)